MNDGGMSGVDLGRDPLAPVAAAATSGVRQGSVPFVLVEAEAMSGVYQNRQLLGKAPHNDDGSVKVKIPSETGVVLELQNDSGAAVVTMTEEHQLGPGEEISMGISQALFNAVCGGCHGSVSGHELDISVTADALTGASKSIAATNDPQDLGN